MRHRIPFPLTDARRIITAPMVLVGIVGTMIALLVGAVVVASVIGQAQALVDAGGWWALGLFLIVPTLIGISWLRERR